MLKTGAQSVSDWWWIRSVPGDDITNLNLLRCLRWGTFSFSHWNDVSNMEKLFACVTYRNKGVWHKERGIPVINYLWNQKLETKTNLKKTIKKQGRIALSNFVKKELCKKSTRRVLGTCHSLLTYLNHLTPWANIIR